MVEQALVNCYGPSCSKEKKQEARSSYCSNSEIYLGDDAGDQTRTQSKCLQTILYGPLFLLWPLGSTLSVALLIFIRNG